MTHPLNFFIGLILVICGVANIWWGIHKPAPREVKGTITIIEHY